MRTFILIAGFVLASATAQAADRNLSPAGVDTPTMAAPAKTADAQKTVEAPQAAEAPAVEAPKYVERPAVVEPKADPAKSGAAKVEQPNTEPATPAVQKTADAPKADKPRRKRYWTEQRIIGELHRHGVYW